ncbi:MAG: cytochrome P450 [Rhodospirillaceae bacterium]|nr:cytochrome P450 [Rhodospirillaceae bacterium]
MPEHAPNLPPGPRLPRPLQASRWLFAPIPFMQACTDRYGDPFTVRMTGLPPMVFFTDPSAIRQIFTGDPRQFRAGQANRVFKAILGPNSLLLLDGRRHKRERKLLMPPFHGARVRLYGEMMWEITDRSIDTWPAGAAFPIHPYLKDITLEVILRVVFGVDEEPRLARLRGLVRDALRILDGSNPLRNIWIWPRFASLRSSIRELLREEVQRRRAMPSNDRTDVMSLLLAARDEDGQPMTDDEIRDEMITLLVAGHESTAASLAWVIHRLLDNPDVLASAQAELVSVAGNGSDASVPTPEQVASLAYLDAIIKETARVNPVVPVVVRQLTTDLSIGNTSLPAGCIAAPCIYLIHRRPDLWNEPDVFDPTRFLDGRVDPYTFFPFGGGVRHCVGAAFATYEMKIVLARVLSRLVLRRAAGRAVRVVRRGLLLCPSQDLRVIMQPADC